MESKKMPPLPAGPKYPAIKDVLHARAAGELPADVIMLVDNDWCGLYAVNPDPDGDNTLLWDGPGPEDTVILLASALGLPARRA